MANTIRHKRGTTRPTASDISTGELAINTAEGKIFTENDSGHIFEAGELLGAFSSSTITYTVTVASKTSAHRYNGTGSSNGYKINGVFSPFLNLAPGNTYKFDQADSSNSGHPFRFYLEADKSTAYTTNVTTSGTPGSSGAYTLIVITDTTPLVLHYQCSAHGYMGNSVLTNSKTVNYNDLQNQPSLFDGNYNSLSNRPTIPTATSDLTNDSGFITSASSTSVVADTSPQLGGDLASNGSDIKFADDDKAIFGTGTGNDMEIFHESSSNVNEIRAIDGEIHIQADNFMLISDDSSGRAIYLDNSSGHLELGFDGSHCVHIDGSQTEFIKDVKFDGATAGRDIVFDRSEDALEFADNAQARFGTGDDLKIYSDGTDSIFENITGAFLFKDTDGEAEFKIQGHEGEAASLFLLADEGDDSSDRWKLTAHTDGNLVLNHHKASTSSYQKTAQFANEGGTELYHSGTKRFETSSSGVTVTGTTTSGYLTLSAVNPNITFTDTNDDSDFRLALNGGLFEIRDITNDAYRLKIASDGTVTIGQNLDALGGVDVTGNITVSGTVDGRDLASDGSKLDGIAAGATNVTNNNQISNGAGYITSASLSGVSDGGNAASLDGIDSSQFVRSDASDTLTGNTYTFNSSTEQKIILRGANNPYVMWQEGTVDKAYIQWNASGYLDIVNNEAGEHLKISTGENGLIWRANGVDYTVYHPGNLSVGDGGLTSNNFTDSDHSKLNGIESGATADQSASEILTLIKTVDGNGSGLDADLLEGLSPSVSASNSTIVARHSSGYIFSNYINTTDNSVTSSVSGLICKQSGNGDYHRTATAAAVRSFLNVADGATAGGGYGAGDNASFNQLDITGTHGIDNEGWYRSDDSGEGMYNTATGQHWYSDHDDYWNIAGGSSANAIRFRDEHAGTIRGYVYADNGNNIGFLNNGGSWAFRTDRSDSSCTLYSQHFYTDTNATYDLGSSTYRWRNVYTSDLDLSNEAKGGNDVDGTWGSYTIQEGQESLFLLNRRNGKKYKFNLTEVS